ncbi:ESX-1 secretion-associated protein [Mycobacterium sp. NPDC003449]
MSGDLRVTPAHLRELSAKQEQAAAALTAATQAVDGVDAAVRGSHGPISWSTAAAVAAAQNARRAAGTGIATVSQELGAKLTSAAGRYDGTDASMGVAIDETVR